MKDLTPSAAMHIIALIGSAIAQSPAPTDGSISACHGQICDDCPKIASANEGFPTCLIYDSPSQLGPSFSSPSGNGYDVWWNSGKPNDDCRIVVRTPASTDLPACGYFLTSWSQAGCYYTSIVQSFMLQYCCGQGDCDAASPAASMADAHAQAKMGNTTILSIPMDDLGASGASFGTRSIEGVGDFSWKRSDHTYTKREPVEEPKVHRRDCTFNPTTDRTSVGGRQVRASGTQVCNTQGGCALTTVATVTEGRSLSATFSLTQGTWNAVGSSLGYTFSESKSYSVSTDYTQSQGTTGYLSYTPTLYCWSGTFSDCYATTGAGAFRIDSNQVFDDVCTPAMRASEAGDMIDGTFSFVYVNK